MEMESSPWTLPTNGVKRFDSPMSNRDEIQAERTSSRDLYAEYLAEIEGLLAQTPSYPDLLNRRGILKLHMGDVSGAKKDFIAALSRNSRYEQARTNLAFALASEDFLGAVDLMASIAKGSDDPVRRFVDMARLCYLHGRRSAAWDAIYHSAQLDANHPLPRHWGAYLLCQEERLREAQRWLLHSARAQGGSVDSYERLGVKESAALDVERFVAEIESVSTLPGFAEIHCETARWLYMSGKTREATAELQKMLAHDPRFAPFATLLGWMEFLSGHHHRAARWLKKALECDGNYARAHEQLAHLYSANGDEIRAEHHLAQAVTLRPGYPDLRYDLALQCARTDRVEEAVPHLRSCLAIAPTFAMARLRLGECLAQLERFETALEHLAMLPEDMQERPEVKTLAASCTARRRLESPDSGPWQPQRIADEVGVE